MDLKEVGAGCGVWMELAGAEILPLPEFDHNALEMLLNFIGFFVFRFWNENS